MRRRRRTRIPVNDWTISFSHSGAHSKDLSVRRLVGLDTEEVGQDIALLGRKSPLVAGRVENDLALIGWNRAQILKGMLDQDAAIGGQGRELAAGGDVKGDVTTLEDLGVLAKLRADED